MIPIPILKVLSSFQKTSVQALLMGGQACVLYGAAEFSRDTDFAVLAETQNLLALQAALDDLKAERIFLPPFEAAYLERGHAIHFRCRHQDVEGMRVDIMSQMRGVAPFSELWQRRTTYELAEGTFEVMGLPDLVQAKKTQRDKDWPMIRRLVDRNYFENRASPTTLQTQFWLRELRTPELLLEVAQQAGDEVARLTVIRPFLAKALAGDLAAVEHGLKEEEARERAIDEAYWRPLRAELEALRHERLKGK